MKKEIFLIISSLILCIICFLNNWFQDEIFEKLFLVIILIDFILLCVYIFLFIQEIKIIKSTQKKNIFVFLPLIILIITVLLSFYDFRFVKTKLELDLYMDKRLEIVKLIKDKELDDKNRNIKLPKYKYVSQDGEVHVYQNNEEQVIGFWVFRGMLSGSVELIYSSSDEQLIKENEDIDVRAITELKEHWYYVVTD